MWVHGRPVVRVAGRAVTFRGTFQAAAGDSLSQGCSRVGGTATVRGYDYGARWSRAAWAGQLDVHLRRRGLPVPVVFLDVGDGVPSRNPLIGAGVGLAVLWREAEARSFPRAESVGAGPFRPRHGFGALA